MKNVNVKVNFDTWIQLLGMTGVLGGLIFVGLEMRQSQQIALAAQQQARTEIFTGIVNSVNESSEVSLYQNPDESEGQRVAHSF